MLKFSERPKTTGITSKKKLKRISCLQVIFVLIWMKQRPIWFKLQRDGIGNGFSNIKDTFAESLQLQMSVLYLQGWFLESSSYDGWAKCKEKVPVVSDLNQNVERTWNFRLKFTQVKDLFIKRAQKNQS